MMFAEPVDKPPDQYGEKRTAEIPPGAGHYIDFLQPDYQRRID